MHLLLLSESSCCYVQECSQPSSQSAGEVCWAPQAEACDQEQDLLRMGTECAAAVNLLSMTQSQSSLQQYVAGAPAFEATLAKPQVASCCVSYCRTAPAHLTDSACMINMHVHHCSTVHVAAGTWQ